MSTFLNVLLATVFGWLLGVESRTGGALLSADHVVRPAERHILGSTESLELAVLKTKEKVQKKKERIEHNNEEIKEEHHAIKVLKGYRGKPSRLDKLEEENQLKLCWWPDNFDHYDWIPLPPLFSTPIACLEPPCGIPTFRYGVHFQVPHNMREFKFVDIPEFGDPLSQMVNQFAHYSVVLLPGQYEVGEDEGDRFRVFRDDNVLYSGRNPPSVFPVKHKDHVFVSVEYLVNPLFIPGVPDFGPINGGEFVPGERKEIRLPFPYFTYLQVVGCAEMSERVGAPVSPAFVSLDGPDNFGFAYLLGGNLKEGPPVPGPTFGPSICTLVPLQASRCF